MELNTFYVLFAAAIIAAAKRPEMKASFNNNLPNQTKGVMVDTGCLVALTRDVHYDIEMVKGIRNIFFGGEGLFYARLEGPGTVWIQTLPFSRLAQRIFSAAPQTGGGGKDEGSILGGLGNLLDGR